ncbi:MAG: hypothetical protein ACTHKV_10855, partial [Flavipsychrobacter sp.]
MAGSKKILKQGIIMAGKSAILVTARAFRVMDLQVAIVEKVVKISHLTDLKRIARRGRQENLTGKINQPENSALAGTRINSGINLSIVRTEAEDLTKRKEERALVTINVNSVISPSIVRTEAEDLTNRKEEKALVTINVNSVISPSIARIVVEDLIKKKKGKVSEKISAHSETSLLIV